MENFLRKFDNFFKFHSNSIQRRNAGFFINFREFLKSEKCLELCGYQFLRFDNLRGIKFRRGHLAAHQILNIFFVILSGVSTILHAREKNFEAAVENFCSIGGFCSTSMMFFYIVFYKRKILREVISKLDEHFPHNGHDQLLYDVRKHFKKLSLMFWLSFLVFWFTLVQFTCFMAEVKIYSWWTSLDIDWVPVFQFWLPFDISSPAIHWPIQVIEVWSLSIVMVILFFSDILYASLMTLLSMEFQILAQKIEEAESAVELKNLIKIHQELIEVTDKMEEVFSPLLLVNIFTTIALMCVGSFLAIVSNSIFLNILMDKEYLLGWCNSHSDAEIFRRIFFCFRSRLRSVSLWPKVD